MPINTLLKFLINGTNTFISGLSPLLLITITTSSC